MADYFRWCSSTGCRTVVSSEEALAGRLSSRVVAAWTEDQRRQGLLLTAWSRTGLLVSEAGGRRRASLRPPGTGGDETSRDARGVPGIVRVRGREQPQLLMNRKIAFNFAALHLCQQAPKGAAKTEAKDGRWRIISRSLL